MTASQVFKIVLFWLANVFAAALARPQFGLPPLGTAVRTNVGAGVATELGPNVASFSAPAVSVLPLPSTLSAIPSSQSLPIVLPTVAAPTFATPMTTPLGIATPAPPKSSLELTILTTVALTDTAALASLQTAAELSPPIFNLPSPLPIDLSSGPAGPFSTGNPLSGSAPGVESPVATALDQIGVDLVQDLANAIFKLMSVLANIAEPEIPASSTGPSPTSALSDVMSLAPDLSPALSTIATETPTASAPTLTNPTTLASDRNPNELKRALPGLPEANVNVRRSVVVCRTVVLPDFARRECIRVADVRPAEPVLRPHQQAPVVGTPSLPVPAAAVVLSIVTKIPLPPNLPTLLQTTRDAAVADLSPVVSNLPVLAQLNQLFALFPLLAAMNVGQLGSLATLTNLPAVQSATAVLNSPDLATAIHVLESKTIVQSTAADELVGDIVGFIGMVWELVPLVQDLRAAVAFVILDQLGVVAARDVLDGTLVESLPDAGG